MITFEESTHTYTDGHGNDWPSVTQIMASAGLCDYSAVPRRLLEVAANRGSIIHKTTQLYDQGVLDESSVDEELTGYLEAYKKFLADFNPIIKLNEEIVWSDIYGYAGTIDRGFEINGENWLIDIKSTAQKMKNHEIQVAAYKHAAVECGKIESIQKGATLYLKADGKYTLVAYQNKNVFCYFLSALSLHKWSESKTNKEVIKG